MEELQEQLIKSARIGQALLVENQELKSRSKEDTEQVRFCFRDFEAFFKFFFISEIYTSILVGCTTSTSCQA